MFVFQRHYWTVLTVPRSGCERRKEAVTIFSEERKAAAAPCTSQEFPLLVGTPWGAGSPASPLPGGRGGCTCGSCTAGLSLKSGTAQTAATS